MKQRREGSLLRCAWLVVCTLLGTAVFLASTDAFAAIRGTRSQLSLEVASNPHKNEFDILLPMPCSASLALRTIAVPGGVENDVKFLMGVKDEIVENRQIYESSFETHIAASFSIEDIPPAWRKRVGVTNPQAFSYYFLGKYEVTKMQWDIVMNAIDDRGEATAWTCPKSVAEKDLLPVTDISWFDVQRFLQRYNAWLVKQYLSSLPSYDDTNHIGFLRLPTEEEWEFAARGGSKVRKEDRDNNNSFLPPGTDFDDYAVFQSQKGTILRDPLPVGQRKPNQLELYDTMGNVSEMIDGFFHVTIAEIAANNEQNMRLHGASGGLTCKGGSFRSEKSGVLPGWRDEMPLYTKSGEYRAHDLGFRVALAGMALPSAQRLKMLGGRPTGKEEVLAEAKAAEKNLGNEVRGSVAPQERQIELNPHGNALAELARIQAVTVSPAVQNNLAQLRTLLNNREQALERQRTDFLEDTVRATLYQAETIRAFAFRYIEVLRISDEAKKKNVSAESKQKLQEYLDKYYQILLTAANQYKNYLRKISKADPKVLAKIKSQLNSEYAGEDTLNEHMQQNLRALDSHLRVIKDHGPEKLNNNRICRDIIPEQHLKKMPHFSKG